MKPGLNDLCPCGSSKGNLPTLLWRLQSHASVDRLMDKVATAFPDLLYQFAPDGYYSPVKTLSILIESRFIEPILTQTFQFTNQH